MLPSRVSWREAGATFVAVANAAIDVTFGCHDGHHMTTTLLDDAFAHHAWATNRLIDVCGSLVDDQLATSVPGTFGRIFDTLRHTVGADCWYLHRLTGGSHPTIDEDAADLAALRDETERHGTEWLALLAAGQDADDVVSVHRDDGSATHAPRGIRLAQALHHGTDHRSQVCTALTALGIDPPEVDAWAFGLATGRVTEVEPTT